MRYFILILFVSSVLTDDKVSKIDEKPSDAANDLKQSVEEPKSKTEKRDSSVHTSSFGINSNAEPFKPMLNPPVKYETAASSNQQVYYNKNQVTAGNAKAAVNTQTANAYREQYSQQQQQQQQQPPLPPPPSPNKNQLRAAVKNAGAQQQIQQQVLYAVPQNPPNHYERIPQQQQQQQQQLQQQQQQQQYQQQSHQLPVPRAPQKQIKYVIAIPMSYLRQLQQELVHHQQQQQEQPSNLQLYKGQQQQQHQFQLHLQPPPQQQQQQPIYSIAGPLARDQQGAYRPFHRFALTAVNDVSTGGIQHHQIGSPAPIPPPALAGAPSSPGYVTQYVQIPASVLMSALQSAQVQQQQQQQRPVHLAQPVYPQQHHQPQQLPQPLQQQQQQIQLPLQYQQPIQQQQHIPVPASQIFYLHHQPQQHLQPIQLKQSLPSQQLTSPPVYAYHVNPLHQQQQQLEQSNQQHQSYLTEQQQQQLNVGKQPLRVRGVRPNVNLAPSQYDTSAATYEHEGKIQLVSIPTPIQTHAHTYPNAHGQQYIAQDPIAQQAQAHQVVQAQQLQAPEAYEQVVHHYSPQYVQQHHVGQQPQQQQYQSHQPQQHRLQVQSPPPAPPSSPTPPPPQHSTPLVEHLNNLPFSQGIHGPTPLPFLRLHQSTGVAPFYNFNVVPPTVPQPFALQSPLNPLGIPFGGHPSQYPAQEINSAALANSADTVPYFHQIGGIRYGTQVFHPPTSGAIFLPGSKPTTSTVSHPSPRVSNVANEQKIAASSAKSAISSVAGSPTIVKYP